METHLGKTTKVLFIWHENWIYHLAAYNLQTIHKICLSDSIFFLSCSLVYSSIYSYWSTHSLDRLFYPTIYALSCIFLLLLAVCAHSCKIRISTTFYYYQTLLWVFFPYNPNFLKQTEHNNKMVNHTSDQKPTKIQQPTLIKSGFFLFITSTRPRRVDYILLIC